MTAQRATEAQPRTGQLLRRRHRAPARAFGVCPGGEGGEQAVALVEELGEDGVDFAGGQQGGAVAEAAQFDVLASGHALGCFPHDPRASSQKRRQARF
jgi:hypothetical protein